MKANSELLRDLSLLLAKYPPEDWKQVLLILEDKDSRERIVTALRVLEDLSLASRVVARPAGRPPEAEPKALRSEESAEYRKLITKLNQMPTAQLKAFAAQSGIRVSAKDSRERVIRRVLAALPSRKAGSRPAQTGAPQQKKHGDGEYEKWVKIIMGRR